MNFRISFTLGLALCLFSFAAVQPALSQGMMPHAVVGFVKEDTGEPLENATVTLQNMRTGGSITNITNSDGRYQADLNSLPSGYQAGDVITVSTALETLGGSAEMTVTASPLDWCNITVSESGEEPISDDETLKIFGINWIVVVIMAVAVILTAIMISHFLLSRKIDEGKENKKGRRRK